MLVQTAPSTRRDDGEIVTLQSQPPALGLSKAFDSLDATMRLAIQSGATTDPPPAGTHVVQTTTGKAGMTMPATGGYRVSVTGAWSRQDRIMFASSVAGALVVGALIVFL
jgi:hypothetical protein